VVKEPSASTVALVTLPISKHTCQDCEVRPPFRFKWLLVAALLSAPISLCATPAARASASPESTVVRPPELRALPPTASPLPQIAAGAIPRPIPDRLTLHPGVADPIFSLLVGLVEDDVYGELSGERVASEMGRLGRKSKLPWQKLDYLTRTPVELGRTAEVLVRFRGDVDLPVPYSVLGYNPGSFNASETCIFREWNLGTVSLSLPETKERKRVRAAAAAAGSPAPDNQVVLENVHLFGLAAGSVAIDIDGLVDRLLGGAIDDTDVLGLALFRHEGVWYGVATGYNKKKQGRSGLFSFPKDEIVFPTPDDLKIVGRTMRGWVEEWGKLWPDSPGGTAKN